MRKKQNSLIAVFLVSLLTGLLLTGCSTNGQTETSGAATESNPDFSIQITGALKEIRERGYLTIGCKNDVPGFGYYNEETREYEGGEIELAWYLAARIFDVTTEEAKKQKLVHFEPVEVSERETILAENEADYVIATYTITDERKGAVSFSESYYRDAVGMMILKEKKDSNSLSDPKIHSVRSLDGKTIGIMSGSTTRKEMLAYLERNSIQISPRFLEYSSYEKLNQALSRGDIDVFCVDTCILKGYLDQKRTILSEHFSFQDYGIGASKDKPELIDAANTVLSELTYLKINLF